MNSSATTKRYPLRAVRYWWTRCALLEELQDRSEELVVADLGCNRGQMRYFFGEAAAARWIGLDWNVSSESLLQAGYDELHECDFDQPLPLPDHAVDSIVFLHVIEHLPRPAFTMAEIARILRPGGVLLGGSPVVPAWIARIREPQRRAGLRKGTVMPGAHINSMSCGRWRELIEAAGMEVEMMTGTFLARWSASPLENQAWWTRLNMLWGALFPPLGGEVYLAARKPLSPR